MLVFVSAFAFVGVAGAQEVPDSGVEIDDRLYEQEGDTVDVVIRFGDSGASGADISDMKREVERNRQYVEKLARSEKGIRIKNSLWLANAVVVSVDTDRVSYKKLSSISGVERLHANFEVKAVGARAQSNDEGNGMSPSAIFSPESPPQLAPNSFTYGLEQINAPEVWSEFGTQGQGSRVAVLDTGIDVDHPDLDLRNEDPGNSTYPGGWAEFDSSGNQVSGSEPQDTDSHGTHVSGTVAGGDASGTAVGVAPETELMHGLVLPGGVGTFAQIVGGMQWAVDNDADVISMSLGSPGFDDAWVEPVRNAEDQGVLVVAAAGNSGEGTSGSPGNIYDSLSVGASDSNRDIAGFSGGEEIVTDDVGGSLPSDWPDEYVVPDVAAPGDSVESTLPDDSYGTLSGTSMATPHVSGTAALMISAAGEDLSPDEIRSTLETTARKPDDWGEPEDERDTRYGFGIIDARNATVLVAVESGVNGTVTDPNGQPVEGAEVSLNGRTVTTDSNGRYQIRAPAGGYSVTASGFGYESETASVTVESGNFTTRDFVLDEELAVRKKTGQPGAIEAGEGFDISFDVANLEEYTAEANGGFPEEDLTLRVNGNEHDFGETITLSPALDGELKVEIGTQESDAAPASLSLGHEFSGAGDTEQISTGPTEVLEELIKVGVVDDIGTHGDELASALNTSLPPAYSVEITDSQLRDHDVYVVQSVRDSSFIQDTLDPSVPAVYLDHWGSASNGVQEFVAATGDPNTYRSDYNAAPPVFHDIEQSHPIIKSAGLETGDRVNIHDHPDGDHAWFNDTDDFDVLAIVGDQQKGLRGPALGVDEDAKIVLASSLGRTRFALNEDFTEEADKILAGSITHLVGEDNDPAATVESGSVNIGSNGGTGESAITLDAEDGMSIANVEVSVDTSVAEIVDVEPGEDVDTSSNAVNYDVIDETNDSVRVEYANIQAQANPVQDFELARIEFEAQTNDGEAAVGITPDGVFDGSQNEYSSVGKEQGRLTVGADPANYELSNLNPAEATVTEGDDPIDVSVDVENTGGIAGNQDLELTVENATGTVFSDTVSGVQVGAGDSTTETFTDVQAGTLAPGEYDHIVSSDNDTVEGNLTVESGTLFEEPLPGFNNPPTNTGELDPTLYEDVNGDGDGLDTSQTVSLWTQLVIDEDAFNDLTQEQVDALDWNGDGQLTTSDAVSLWTQQVLAS